jgi:NAD-dependent dihydropyrimidine dehydrogenase PreA subunit/nitroreductase
MAEITISDSCKKCRVCVELCPNLIMKVNEQGQIVPQAERRHLCIECGQCMAACSSKSISAGSLSYDNDFFEAPHAENAAAAYDYLIQTRRSVRNFKDKAVEKEVFEKIVQAISFAPPAFPPIKFSIMAINDRELLKKSLPLYISMYEGMMKMMKNPIPRFFIRRAAGGPRFKIIQNHLMPILEADMPLMKNGSEDTLMRHAPAMILFLQEKNSEDIQADVYIAATIATLAAHAYGLGSTIVDIIAPAIQRTPGLRTMYNIPEDKDVVAALILGYPRYKYHRAVKRKIPSVLWR